MAIIKRSEGTVSEVLVDGEFKKPGDAKKLEKPEKKEAKSDKEKLADAKTSN